MNILLNAISIPYKDDRTYPIYLRDSNNAPFDASGWKIYFNVKRNLSDTDANSVISKVIDFDDAPNVPGSSTAFLVLTTTDTNLGAATYYYNARVVDADGKKQSTAVAKFIIEPVVNEDGA